MFISQEHSWRIQLKKAPTLNKARVRMDHPKDQAQSVQAMWQSKAVKHEKTVPWLGDYLLPLLPMRPSGLHIPNTYSSHFSFSDVICWMRLRWAISSTSLSFSLRRFRSSSSLSGPSVTPTVSAIRSSFASISSSRLLAWHQGARRPFRWKHKSFHFQ